LDTVKTTSKPLVMVAPLDWGLGHTTRCIPIIKELLNQKYPVILAGDERAKTIYNSEFPGLPFIYLKGYKISYSSFRFLLPFKLALQIPRILKTIRNENKWLKKIIAEYPINIVISDNRYGLYNKKIKSIFITHQLAIKTSLGFKTDAFIQKLNYSFINQFNKCWIPDTQSEPSLAGDLSHPFKDPSIQIRYLGALSRFRNDGINSEKKHLLFLLSGPEPQRTQLEKMLVEQSKNYKGNIVVVRGLPTSKERLQFPANFTIFNHLPADTLKEFIAASAFVIARCGYSTIMDMVTMKQKCILIPTPGQTEQEYLARHLMKHNIALCINQKKFQLNAALQLASNFPFSSEDFLKEKQLKQEIEQLNFAI
jgi:uncharacterized protein (TIGR00661 family)